ncbi:hypothetical protein N8486_05070 [Akkermansiaceae bacterium]|nr:hypothetical protein [Akkermansiaceae bacterium]
MSIFMAATQAYGDGSRSSKCHKHPPQPTESNTSHLVAAHQQQITCVAPGV